MLRSMELPPHSGLRIRSPVRAAFHQPGASPRVGVRSRWDDTAKIPGLKVEPLESYRNLLVELEAKSDESIVDS